MFVPRIRYTDPTSTATPTVRLRMFRISGNHEIDARIAWPVTDRARIR
jgi:hypothetical protein